MAANNFVCQNLNFKRHNRGVCVESELRWLCWAWDGGMDWFDVMECSVVGQWAAVIGDST
jgi:hypothetical protein